MDPTRNVPRGARARASRIIADDASTPTTSYPASINPFASTPLPHPASTMRPRRMPFRERMLTSSGTARRAKSLKPASWTYARSVEYTRGVENASGADRATDVGERPYVRGWIAREHDQIGI